MTIIRELITVLGFQVDESGAKKGESAFAVLKTSAFALTAAATGAAVAIGLITNEAIGAARETENLAKIVGLSTDELQKLQFVASRTGVEAESLFNVIRDLSDRVGDAALGNKTFSEAFRRLGVQIKRAGKIRPTIDIFEDFADALNDMEDQGQRTFTVLELLEDSGLKVDPVFRLGAAGIRQLSGEARQLGVVLDRDTLGRILDLGKSISVVSIIAKSLSRRLASSLAPSIKRVSDGIQTLILRNRGPIDSFFASVESASGGFSKSLANLGKFLMENNRLVKSLTISLGSLAVLFGVTTAAVILSNAAVARFLLLLFPLGKFLLLAVLIGLAWEDISAFIDGSESALGNFIDAFTAEARKPGSNFIVQTMALILFTIGEAIKSVATLIGNFAELGLSAGFLEPIQLILEDIGKFIDSIVEKMGNLLRAGTFGLVENLSEIGVLTGFLDPKAIDSLFKNIQRVILPPSLRGIEATVPLSSPSGAKTVDSIINATISLSVEAGGLTPEQAGEVVREEMVNAVNQARDTLSTRRQR